MSEVINEPLPIFSSGQGTTIQDYLKEWQQQQVTGAAQSQARNPISQSDTLKLIDRDDLPPQEEYHLIGATADSLAETPYENAFLRKGDVTELR